MLSDSEIYKQVLEFARSNDLIRVVGLNGSRTNKNVPEDDFRDFDIAYIVQDMSPFVSSEGWLDYFGERVIMQKPEAMSLFAPELGNWFSYLALFKEGHRIDFMFIPESELDKYLADDKLTLILLDKDGLAANRPQPTDADHHVKMPDKQMFEDCCNEFWWVSTYVIKGLCRNELLYAAEHLESYVRKELLRMITWKIGIDTGFSLSVGKCGKFIDKYVPPAFYNKLKSTYDMSSNKKCLRSLFGAMELFRQASKYVAEKLGYDYPDFDESVTAYIDSVLIENKIK